MLAPAAAPLSFSLKPQIYFQGLLECLLVQTKLLIRAQDESSSPPAYNENRLTGCFVLQRYIPVLLLLSASSYPVESQNGKGRAFITPLQPASSRMGERDGKAVKLGERTNRMFIQASTRVISGMSSVVGRSPTGSALN